MITSQLSAHNRSYGFSSSSWMVANFKKCELCIIYAWLCVSHAYLYRYYLHRYRIFVIFRWLGFLFFSFCAGCGVGGALFTGVYKWYKWYRALKRKALFSPRLKFSIWLKKKKKKDEEEAFFNSVILFCAVCLMCVFFQSIFFLNSIPPFSCFTLM